METARINNPLKDLFYHLIAVLCIVPLAPMINRVIPPVLLGGFNLDLIIAILLSIFFVRFVFWLVKPLIIPSFLMIALIMLLNMYNNTYTVSGMVSYYRSLVANNWENRQSSWIILQGGERQFLDQPGLFSAPPGRSLCE